MGGGSGVARCGVFGDRASKCMWSCKPLLLSVPSGQISCNRASEKTRQLTTEDVGGGIIPEA